MLMSSDYEGYNDDDDGDDEWHRRNDDDVGGADSAGDVDNDEGEVDKNQ